MSSTDEDEDDGAMAHHFSGEGCFRKQSDFGRVEILEEPPRHAAVVLLLLGNRNRHEHPLKATTKPTTIVVAGCIIRRVEYKVCRFIVFSISCVL